MHIVSYRGPGAGGGVSAALARAWDCNVDRKAKWWHLSGHALQVSTRAGLPPSQLADIPEEVVKAHYRFCNDFLWPVMHDLPQYASYSEQDYAFYKTFNETYGWCLARSQTGAKSNDYFVQDYQLAVLPHFLKNAGFRSVVFWHIPWPKRIDERWIKPLAEIARALLNAEAIGFHTDEYAENFLNFVAANLSEFGCNLQSKAIWLSQSVPNLESSIWAVEAAQPITHTVARSITRTIRVLVAPLGIDYDHWEKLSSQQQNHFPLAELMPTPYVLSVDRADYTKGVTNRIQAIDTFFSTHPEWVGKVSFAQICAKTRDGLTAFDNYWRECQLECAWLEKRWSTANWKPLIWIEKSLAPAELAQVYRAASALLISAVRDGLNLTAKEFVATQGRQAGVLLLAKGTGAWHELGSHCLPVEATDPDQIADAIHQALTMDKHERAWRMAVLKEQVRANTLSAWWRSVTGLLDSPQSAPLSRWLDGADARQDDFSQTVPAKSARI